MREHEPDSIKAARKVADADQYDAILNALSDMYRFQIDTRTMTHSALLTLSGRVLDNEKAVKDGCAECKQTLQRFMLIITGLVVAILVVMLLILHRVYQ